MFRLGLLNPNTDERHTVAMRDVALAALPEGCEVTARTAPRGPKAIESEVDSVLAAAEVVAMMQSLLGLDAYLIACFGDPGLDAARELTDAPVVGIGEAAYQAVRLIAKRFAIITTLPRGIAELEDALERQGLRAQCVGVVPLKVSVSDQGSDHPDTTAAIIDAGRQVVYDHGAEALVLACGGMANVAEAVRDGVGVPICDGVSFGTLIAFSLWRSGLLRARPGPMLIRSPFPTSAWPTQRPLKDADTVRSDFPGVRRT
jgi:allantoin racemase